MRHRLAAIDRTIATLTARLLDSRTEAGFWEGRLATSALSTATATVALTLAGRETIADAEPLIRSGCQWLIANQNADGGWGDTVGSLSNISTTSVCWSALTAAPLVPQRTSLIAVTDSGLQRDSRAEVVPMDDPAGCAIQRAESWLRGEVGALDPERLASAIIARYGADRTFSVPILVTLALTGRLGPGAEAWKMVPQLPFELAACPPALFRWLRLPVVSYALPALVALGQVRHHHAPSRNLLLRMVRSSLRKRTLDAARRMQPEGGGYLEATPLTAFVIMGLVASGHATHPIVQDGINFLKRSARANGGWPIDTNLATWVTTLSVKSLHDADAFGDRDRGCVLEWLLNQQYRDEHSFTHAKPGGWAWTNLDGGVPDTDDTAGALMAIRKLGGSDNIAAATAGLEWLLELQNRDGGMPTFCRGWGRLPFDRSAPDLTAHAIEAWDAWFPALPSAFQRRIRFAAARAVAYLKRTQHADGSWAPLWFGNQHAVGEANLTYGSSRGVVALGTELARQSPGAKECRARAVHWLLRAQDRATGGWGGVADVPVSIEETGLALHALATATEGLQQQLEGLRRGVDWLIESTDEGRHIPPSPIGLYFARLWYCEELYPLVFGLRGLVHARAALSGET